MGKSPRKVFAVEMFFLATMSLYEAAFCGQLEQNSGSRKDLCNAKTPKIASHCHQTVTPAGLVQHQQADVILKCTLYCLNSLAGRWLMTKSKCVSLTKQSSSWVEELYVGSKPLLKSTFSYWSLHLRRENQFYFLMPHNCPLESRPL